MRRISRDAKTGKSVNGSAEVSTGLQLCKPEPAEPCACHATNHLRWFNNGWAIALGFDPLPSAVPGAPVENDNAWLYAAGWRTLRECWDEMTSREVKHWRAYEQP